ncbi:MAG: class I SAM-dependent methyltransferase [Candidatus Binatia bacterium]
MQHELYGQRSADISGRERAGMWGVLCRVVLQRYVRPEDTVLDLGAGRCEFINAIQCSRKIAVDTNPRLREFAASGIVPVIGEIPGVLEHMVDACTQVVFCSNFFERLRDKESVLRVLRNVHRLLVPAGRLIIIQPNIRYAYKEYWDLFDHQVPLSHDSLSEALQMSGFDIEVLRPRFLPYITRKSRLPQAAWLVRLYLALPPAQWLLGKQMLVVARKSTPVRAN